MPGVAPAAGGGGGAQASGPVSGTLPPSIGGAARPIPPTTVPDSVVEAWRREVGPSVPGPIAVGDSVVLVGTGNGRVLALSTATGERFWRRKFTGSATSGVVRRGNELFIASDHRLGRLYRLRLVDGEREWESEVGGAPFPPLPLGDRLYAATRGGDVVALDARTGAERWRRSLDAPIGGAPVAHGAALLVPAADTLLWLDLETGERVAQLPMGAHASADPVVSADRLHLPLESGEVVAVDLRSRKPAWRTGLGEVAHARPVAGDDGALYVLTRAAELWRVRPEDGAAERAASFDASARASLAWAGDRLLVGLLDGVLVAVTPEGERVWSRHLGEPIVSPAVAWAGAVYVPLLGGTIVKLEAAP